VDSGPRYERNIDERELVIVKKIMFLISMLLAMSLAMIPAMALEPCPLAVKFITSPPEANIGLETEILYGGKVVAAGTSNEFGELVVDLGDANIPNCVYQNFELVVKRCADNSLCHKTISFNPQGYTNIDLISVNLFEPVVCEECPPVYPVCNVQGCRDLGWMPSEECLTCESQGYIKPEDCPVKECPDIALDVIVSIIISLAVGAGVGFKVTKYGTKTHYHPGRSDYHSPDVMHSAPYTHKKGELFPKYEKDEAGKWKYVG